MEEDLKKKVEALLFSCGRKISVSELANLIKASEDDVKNALVEIKSNYEEKQSPMMVVDEGEEWKMTTREKYLDTVRKITPHTELSKTIMETLAVVAWKQPVLQADVIKIRTNKAYDHIDQLENMGFLSKEKYSRTYKLKLTQKFYDYFDLREDEDVKKLFRDVKDEEHEEEKVSEFKEEMKKVGKELGESEKGLEGIKKDMEQPFEETPKETGEEKDETSEEKEDVYEKEGLEEMEESDEVTPEEEGFMEGYDETKDEEDKVFEGKETSKEAAESKDEQEQEDIKEEEKRHE